MQITYKQLILAEAAMRPLLRVRGATIEIQLDLIRYYKEVKKLAEDYIMRETELAQKHGAVLRNGKAEFSDVDEKSAFEAAKEKAKNESVEFIPLVIAVDNSIWQATTPEMLMALEGIIVPEVLA